MLACFINMFRKEKTDQGTETKPKLFLIQIFGYFLMAGLTTSLALIGDKPLISQTQGNDCPIIYVLILQGLVMQHMTSHTMMHHAMKQEYNPFDNRLAVFMMVACVCIITTEPLIDIKKSVIALIVI